MKYIWELEDIRPGLHVYINSTMYVVIIHNSTYNLVNLTTCTLFYAEFVSKERLAKGLTASVTSPV